MNNENYQPIGNLLDISIERDLDGEFQAINHSVNKLRIKCDTQNSSQQIINLQESKLIQ